MKSYVIFLLTVIFSFVMLDTKAQDSNWEATVSYSLEEHDKRLHDFPFKESLLRHHPEKWGTHRYSIGVNYNLLPGDAIDLKVGVNYTNEIQTFNRPFARSPFFTQEELNNPSIAHPAIILYTRPYTIKMIQLPIIYNHRIFAGLKASVSILPAASFYKSASNGFHRFMVDFHSVAINAGLQYDFQNFFIGADYRFYQYKRIDEVIFGELLYSPSVPPDPRFEGEYENFNPIQLRITVGYKFGK